MPLLLVIDDEPLILDSFRYLFTEPAAAEGIEFFSRQRPDAVILDVQLPDMTGLELCRRLRQQDPRVPIILMTGHGTAATAIEAMQLGAYEYLVKPLDHDEIELLVSRTFKPRYQENPEGTGEAVDRRLSDSSGPAGGCYPRGHYLEQGRNALVHPPSQHGVLFMIRPKQGMSPRQARALRVDAVNQWREALKRGLTHWADSFRRRILSIDRIIERAEEGERKDKIDSLLSASPWHVD